MNKIGTKILAALLPAALAFSLAGCGGAREDGVTVQSVAELNGMGYVGFTDRFAGVAVAGKTTEYRPDPSLTLDEVKVSEGQTVKKGDVLFTYNNDAAALSVEQAKLELESMKNRILSFKGQIAELEKERDAVGSGEKLNYTLEIQGLQADVRETEYNVAVKEKELRRLEQTAADAEVRSETDGRVTEIHEPGETGDDGGELPLVTVVELGNLRIKGRINELNRGAVSEGQTVTVRSRTDETASWRGTVQSIDWENPENGGGQKGYYDVASDEMTASSDYPFYITLDDAAGLIIGQHVYIEPGEAAPDGEALRLPSCFVMEAESEPWVWAAKGDKLEKRGVTLGGLDEETGEYAVLDGLTATDYVAFPEDGLQAGMRVVKAEAQVPADKPVFNGADVPDGDDAFFDGTELPGADDGSRQDAGDPGAEVAAATAIFAGEAQPAGNGAAEE